MKNIALLLAFITALNLAYFALLLGYVWQALVLLILGVAPLVKFSPPKPKEQKGWALLSGVELTNPEKPIHIKTVVLEDKALALGSLSVAAPGSGKSESISIGLLHYWTHLKKIGWSYFEGKGQRDIYQKACAAGCKPDRFFSTVYSDCDTINLMDASNATQLTERLIQTLIDTEGGNAFYVNKQKAALNMLVPLITNIGYQVTLRDFFVFLSNQSAGLEVISLAKQKRASPASIQFATEWFGEDFNDRISEIDGMLTQLFTLVRDDEIGDKINAYNPTINIRRDINAGLKLYWHLPLSDIARTIAIMISEEMSAIATERQTEGPQHYNEHHLMFDDWGGMVYKGFAPFTARCRSAKLPPHFTFQNVAQLEAISHSFSHELKENTAVKIHARANSHESASNASILFGTYETKELSASVADARDMQNFAHTNDFRVKRDDVMNLDAGEAFVTSAKIDGASFTRQFYRCRFPLVNTDGWEDVEIQTKSTDNTPNDDRPCLKLWDRYYGLADAFEDEPEVDESETKEPPKQKSATKKKPVKPKADSEAEKPKRKPRKPKEDDTDKPKKKITNTEAEKDDTAEKPKRKPRKPKAEIEEPTPPKKAPRKTAKPKSETSPSTSAKQPETPKADTTANEQVQREFCLDDL